MHLLDTWHLVARQRAFEPKETQRDLAIDDLAALLDRLQSGCLQRLLPFSLLASLAVLVAAFFWVVPTANAFQIISDNAPHACRPDGTLAPFTLELDNSANTVSVSWTAQPVETVGGLPWAQIQPSQGTLQPGQRQEVKLSGNWPVCSSSAAGATTGHTGAELLSARAQVTAQYHVSVTISGRTTRVTVVALSVVSLVPVTPTVSATSSPQVCSTSLHASITSPSNGASYSTNQNPISFSGSYSAGCGSIPGNDMSWYANGTLMGTGVSVSFNLAVGSYTIQFTVHDPTSGQKASATISITVGPYCTLLQASITSPSDGAQFTTNQNPIMFSGTYSGGCGDSIPNSDMSWTANGNFIGNGPSPSATLAPGNYTITFTVTDPLNNQPGSDSIQIGVNGE